MPGPLETIEQRVVSSVFAQFWNCRVVRDSAPEFKAVLVETGRDLDGYAHGLVPLLRYPVQGVPLRRGETINIDNVAYTVTGDPEPDGSPLCWQVVLGKESR